jgi:hypothetical protein
MHVHMHMHKTKAKEAKAKASTVVRCSQPSAISSEVVHSHLKGTTVRLFSL